MDGLLGEESAVERVCYQARSYFASIFFFKFAVEAWQQLENRIEIILEKIIQKNLNGGTF